MSSSAFQPEKGVTTTSREDFWWWTSLFVFFGLMLAAAFLSQQKQMSVAILLMGAAMVSIFSWVISNVVRELRGTGPCARYEAALKEVSTPVLEKLVVEGELQESSLRAIRTVLKGRRVA